MFGLAVFLLAEAIAPKPIGEPSRWITSDDYPVGALAKAASGATLVELVIDASGRVSQCRTDESSGSIELDATACALFKARGKFTPGRDANGKRVESLYRQRVAWVMPKDMIISLPPEPEVLAIAVDVSVDGHVERCELLEGKAMVELGKLNPCIRFAAGTQLRRAADDKGEPVPYRMVMRQSTTFSTR